MKLSSLNPRNWLSARPPAPPAARELVHIGNAQNKQMLRARFENAFTTDENRNLYALADSLSVDAAASYETRRMLRMRNRHEYHHNCWYQGAAQRLAKFVIGTGPQLHLRTTNKELNTLVKAKFKSWATKIDLAQKLRTSRAARCYNGEGFLAMFDNPNLDHPVKLDLRELEADQVTSPLFGMYPANYPDNFFDGLVLDPYGNPQTYHVLRQHPGAMAAFVLMGYEYDPIAAKYIIHDFRKLRPGQRRGIPECDPALPKLAELRRYGMAELAAAETASDNAGTVQTDAAAATSGGVVPEVMDRIALMRRQLTFLPAGWKMSQMKAEHPTTAYGPYVMSLLTEISQTLDMPLFIFTGDAQLANMSSAYVASQSFINSVMVDRSEYDNPLDRVFDEFLTEAIRIPGYLPRDLPAEFPHEWRWPRVHAHADPVKMAAAADQRLKAGTSSIPYECSLDGNDWEEMQEADAKSLGMKIDEYRAAVRELRFSAKGNPNPASIAPEKVTDQPSDDPADDVEVEEDNDD